MNRGLFLVRLLFRAEVNSWQRQWSMHSSTSVAFGLKEVNTYRVQCTSLQLSAAPACQNDGNSSKKRKNACTKGGISVGLQVPWLYALRALFPGDSIWHQCLWWLLESTNAVFALCLERKLQPAQCMRSYDCHIQLTKEWEFFLIKDCLIIAGFVQVHRSLQILSRAWATQTKLHSQLFCRSRWKLI